MCVVHAYARVALAHARLCMQNMTRTHIKMKCKEKHGTFRVYSPKHSYVTIVFVYNLHIIIFSRVYSYVTRTYSCVTRIYSCGVLVTITS